MAERAHLAFDLFVLTSVVFVEEAAAIGDALIVVHSGSLSEAGRNWNAKFLKKAQISQKSTNLSKEHRMHKKFQVFVILR